jgi:tRNA(fMet)-specific endonuclease VapC
MPGSTLLDTTAVIALFAGEKAVCDRIARASVLVSSTVLGELYYGALKSARSAANLARIEEFASSVGVLACDAATARHYAQVKERLRAKGRPIPENDIWIAAVAMQHSLPLATRDKHFQEVDGLLVENW